MKTGPLDGLQSGQVIPFGGDQVVLVDDELAAAFRPGDRLVVVQSTGALLRIPKAEYQLVDAAVSAAHAQLGALRSCDAEALERFFLRCADLLESEPVLGSIRQANEADIESALARQRSTGRLLLSDSMLADMISGLRMWASLGDLRSESRRRIEHEGWVIEESTSPVGVIGFVFEGRPNVVVDALGVLRSGNTAVLRIGSDALGTARALFSSVIEPARREVGLPGGVISLIDSTAHAAGWALFGDHRLALAVARGSGSAVAQLGAVARQAGVAVSLHGTGGAWMVAAPSADWERLRRAVEHSLDRKVCNTLNVCCVTRSMVPKHLPAVLAGLKAAADRRGTTPVLHLERQSMEVIRALGEASPIEDLEASATPTQPTVVPIERAELGREWEWDERPEMSLVIVDDLAEAVSLFNAQSPRFVASLISTDEADHEWFCDAVEAPFVSDGFTRWVDGQYALGTPELGLSNWEFGRLLGRSAILSGDSVHTLRLRARIADEDLHR